MRISDWSSDVCSSDLRNTIHHARGRRSVGRSRRHRSGCLLHRQLAFGQRRRGQPTEHVDQRDTYLVRCPGDLRIEMIADRLMDAVFDRNEHEIAGMIADTAIDRDRSEEHTSELQSLMRISYAVFCLKKK